MKKKETKFKEKLQERLKKVSGLWYCKIAQISVRGTPDMLMCFNGKFIAYELKTDVGSPDPLQEYTLENIRRAGGVARVVSPKNVRQVFLEDFMEEY